METTVAEDYDYSIHYNKWHKSELSYYDQMASFYRSLLGKYLTGLASDARLLDIGCGQGFLVYALNKMGFANAAGVDLSSQQIEAARIHKLNCLHIDADYIFQQADATPAIYDAVFLMDVLEHISHDLHIRFLRSVSKLLRPDGVLFISVPNANSSLAARWRYIDWTHVISFTEHSLEFVLLNSKFKNVEFLPYEFHKRPRFPFIPRPVALHWWLFKFVRGWRRLEMYAELGAEGKPVPLSLNLLVRCVKANEGV